MSLYIRSREHRVAGHPILGELAVHREIRSIARQTENWLRADIYVTTAATSTQMPASIRRRLLHWVIVALPEALNGSLSKVCVEEIAAVRAPARGCRSLTRPTPKAIADLATFSAQEWLCFANR